MTAVLRTVDGVWMTYRTHWGDIQHEIGCAVQTADGWSFHPYSGGKPRPCIAPNSSWRTY